MVIAPAEVPVEAAAPLLQLTIPAVPVTLQVTPPLVFVGATPAVPVTVAVNVNVEGTEPPPLDVSITVGVTLAIVTTTGAVAAKAL